MAKYMIIDGIRVEFDKEKNILELVRKSHEVPIVPILICKSCAHSLIKPKFKTSLTLIA